jgi:hypothetical protein
MEYSRPFWKYMLVWIITFCITKFIIINLIYYLYVQQSNKLEARATVAIAMSALRMAAASGGGS